MVKKSQLFWKKKNGDEAEVVQWQCLKENHKKGNKLQVQFKEAGTVQIFQVHYTYTV